MYRNGAAQQIAVRTISALSLDVLGEVIGMGPCCIYFELYVYNGWRLKYRIIRCCDANTGEYPRRCYGLVRLRAHSIREVQVLSR